MSREVKVWSVSVAARYREGVLLEEIDNRYMSDGRPFMVPVEDYNALESKLDRIIALVNEQAEDEGLWTVPIPPQRQSIVEAYLQQQLRRLHRVIEGRP